MFDPKYSIDPSAETELIKLARPTSAQLRRIHELCQQFELAWHSGQRPVIEKIIECVPAEDQSHLLESLVRSEIELCESTGQEISASELLMRFSWARGVVLRAFVPVAQVERLDGWDIDTIAAETVGNTVQTSVETPQRIGPYAIISEIARGGMGIVYRARQTQLCRDVALKIIRSGQFADEVEVARFRKESMAVGGLQHDGIVPVYDVGHDQGFHYYAMPLISGEDLAAKIAHGPLPASEIASIVRDAAKAVQFAHERGVVHRDLKPRNILVDEKGKVHVADFGLAKLVGLDQHATQSSELTESGQIVGTPAYMAPEQVTGQADPLSDVYSLGAVLYTGVTGRPPHQAATPLETVRQLLDQEPVAPRRLNSLIPRDLDTIILKALSKSPVVRYASAGELAQELDRFLQGRPIKARPLSAPEQLWRWAKRQPIVASLTAAVLFSLTAGLAFSLWLFSIARTNERTAVKNADFAVQTVKRYLTEVAENPELKEVGMESFRRQLLLNAQEFYKQMEGQATKSSALPESQAETYFQLAFISNELGEPENANSHYGKAIDAYRHLVSSRPENLVFQRRLASCLQNQGLVFFQSADAKEGELKLREAVKILQALNEKTLRPEDAALWASALSELGQQVSAPERAQEQKDLFNQVAEICVQLRSTDSDFFSSAEAQSLIQVYDRLALNLQFRGELDKAEQWFQQGGELTTKILQGAPKNAAVLFGLARAHKGLNLVFAKLQRFTQAETEFDAADKIYQQLRDSHPLVFAYLDDLATLSLNQGTQLVIRNELQQAENLLRRSRDYHLQLVARQPNSFSTHRDLGLACSTLATALMKRGELVQAEQIFRQCVEVLEVAKSINPDDLGLAYFSAAASTNLGDLLSEQGKSAESLQVYGVAKSLGLKLTSQENCPPPFLTLAAKTSRSLANAYWKNGDPEKAEAESSAALEVISKLMTTAPDSADNQHLEASLLVLRGEVFLMQNRLDEAREVASRAYDAFTKLIGREQSPQRFQSAIGEVCYLLGRVSSAEKQSDKAIEWFHQAIAAQEKEYEVRKSDSDLASSRARTNVGNSYYHLAVALAEQEKQSEALKACTAAISFQTKFANESAALLQRVQESNE